MRPVVGCWFFLFCFFLASALVVSRSAAQATSVRMAAKAALGLSIGLDLLHRRAEVFALKLLARAAAAGAGADGEQARPEEEQRNRLGHGGSCRVDATIHTLGGRRGRHFVVAAAGADAADADERDA